MKIINGLFITCVLIINIHTAKVFGQDQNIPAFVKPPKLIQDPGSYYKYSSDSRKFTGISSMAVGQDGIMWAVWYAGPTPGEDNNNYVVVATSSDKGVTWKEILAIDPDGKGPIRAFDPEVWIDPNGKLWVFWAQGISGKIQVEQDGYIAGVWAITNNDPSNFEGNWTSPKRLADGIMMCKPAVLSSGEWILPISTWMLTKESAKVAFSSNEGESWSIRGGAHIPKDVRTFDEHMIVEKKDGSLWMLVRTKYGIGESMSTDRGRTWSDLKPSDLKHPSARFFIRRLNSGNLLLVKHGPISIKTGRSHLMAFISKDDGNSWSKGLLLDQRPGVSYPDGQQMEDGTIYITYDYDRTGKQKILMTSFTEENVLSEKNDENIIKVFDNRKVISDGGR